MFTFLNVCDIINFAIFPNLRPISNNFFFTEAYFVCKNVYALINLASLETFEKIGNIATIKSKLRFYARL